MQISPLSPGLFLVEQNGTRELGIAIGPSNGSLVGTLGKFKQSEGHIVSPDGTSVRPWKIAGFVASGGTLLTFGPWMPGPESYSSIYQLSSIDGLQRTIKLARAADILDRNKVLPRQGLNLDGFVYFEDGSLLVLPDPLQELLRQGKNIQERFLPYEALHHPSLKGSAAWSFSLLVLAFRLMCGTFPYEKGSKPEEWISRIVTRALETPRCCFPEAPQDLENMYLAVFIRQNFVANILATVPAVLALWLEAGGKNTAATIQNKAQKSLSFRLTRYRARRFVRHNRLWIGVSAAAFFVGCVIIASILGQYFRQPLTVGMSPLQVVQNFYNSYNTLDSEFMEDATHNNTAQNAIGEISNLFIIDRVRSASENRKVHFTPQEWLKSGKPGAEYSLIIFGIDKLVISIHDPIPSTGIIPAEADFELYSNVTVQEAADQTQPVLPKTVRLTHEHQLLTLKKDDRGNWFILSVKDVPPS